MYVTCKHARMVNEKLFPAEYINGLHSPSFMIVLRILHMFVSHMVTITIITEVSRPEDIYFVNKIPRLKNF